MVAKSLIINFPVRCQRKLIIDQYPFVAIAILFGKVLRIQSHAQVIFSDPIVIRYGSGVQGDDADNEEHEEESHKTPCPVLEFRIVNRLFNEVGGEIMDGKFQPIVSDSLYLRWGSLTYDPSWFRCQPPST